jgi:hypothetical protein
VQLPVHEIHLHISNDLPVSDGASIGEAELEALARQLTEAFADRPDDRLRLLDGLHLIDPFNRAPDQARRIAERLRS